MDVYVENEILYSIDAINYSVQESAISVLDAMIKEYDKISNFFEFSIFQEAVITEGKILDEATGKNTFDGTFKKILLFIPRLLAGIVKAIASVFTDKFDEDVDKNAPEANENLKNENDPQKLAIAQVNTQTVSNGEITFEPRKKHFILGDKFAHIKNYIKIVSGVCPIIKKLRTGGTSYATIVKELRSILSGETTMDEARVLTSDVMFELVKDSSRVSRAASGIIDEVRMSLTKKLQMKAAAGQDISEQAEIKDMLDELSKYANICSTVTTFGAIGGKLAKYMANGGPFFIRKIASAVRNKLAYDKEEDDAIAEEKRKQRELNAKAKGAKQEAKRLEKDTKRIAKKQEKLQKLREGNVARQDALADARLERELARETKQDQKDEFWGRPTQDSAEIDTADNEILDEGTLSTYFATGDDGGTEIIDGKEYSKTFLGSLRGGPETKAQEDLRKKFNNSILAKPLFDKDAQEYWEKHKNDDDYDAFNDPHTYKDKDKEVKDPRFD